MRPWALLRLGFPRGARPRALQSVSAELACAKPEEVKSPCTALSPHGVQRPRQVCLEHSLMTTETCLVRVESPPSAVTTLIKMCISTDVFFLYIEAHFYITTLKM